VGDAATRAAAAAQIFVADPASPEPSDADRHHLWRVLRLRDGELVVAADGRGRWSLCRSRPGPGPHGDGGRLEPEGPVATEPAAAPALTVAFTPVKGDRPEWVVQKLTELGVDRIVPLATARSVVLWRGERGERAVERLRRVAREAAAQSRRVWLPEVSPVHTLDGLVAAQDAAGAPLALAQLDGGPPTGRTTAVAVGPEGGWGAEELALGCPTVGLGDNVLRAETAAVAAGAILAALRAGVVGRRADPGRTRAAAGEVED
jgi:16S rRNA (uracil1498-N3)-methyltransferase